jgi:hypothetical protein
MAIGEFSNRAFDVLHEHAAAVSTHQTFDPVALLKEGRAEPKADVEGYKACVLSDERIGLVTGAVIGGVGAGSITGFNGYAIALGVEGGLLYGAGSGEQIGEWICGKRYPQDTDSASVEYPFGGATKV